MIKVGDMVITKPELNLRDGAILTPAEVISIKNPFIEVKGAGYYLKDVLQKVNKYDFALSREEVLPDLYLNDEQNSLCVSPNYDEWRLLKKNEDKLFISIHSKEEQQEFAMSLSLTQVEELIKYLNKFQEVIDELKYKNFKRKMTLKQIEEKLGYEIDLMSEEEF